MAYEDDEEYIPGGAPVDEPPQGESAPSGGDEWKRAEDQSQPAPPQDEWARAEEQGPPPAQDEWVRATEQGPPPADAPKEPEAEGEFASGVRDAAHTVLPTIAGAASWGPGAAAGAAIGSMVPGVGTLAGGIAGGLISAFGGGTAAALAQEWLLKKFGFDDEAQRAANAKANPISTAVGAVAGALPTFGVGGGAALAARALSGVIGGGVDLAMTGDPTHALATGVASTALNKPTALGGAAMRAGEQVAERVGLGGPSAAKLSTLLAEKVQENTHAETPTGAAPEGAATKSGDFPPGRPDEAPGVATELHKEDVKTSGTNGPGSQSAAGTSSEAPPPVKEGIVSEPQNQPFRDEGNKGGYAKDKVGVNEGGQEPTPLGTISEDVRAALKTAPTEEPKAPVQQAQQDQPPVPPEQRPPVPEAAAAPPKADLVKSLKDEEAKRVAAAENPPSEFDAAAQKAVEAAQKSPYKNTGRAARQQDEPPRRGPPQEPPKPPGEPPEPGPKDARLNKAPLLESAPNSVGAVFRRIFAPEYMSPASEKAAGVLRKGQGVMQGLDDKWTAKLEKHYPAIEKLDRFGMDALTDHIEGGNSPRFKGWQVPENLKGLVKDIEAHNAEYKDAIARHADDPDAVQAWNTNHLPHLYKDPDKVRSFIERGEGGGGNRGSGGSLNARKFETYETALEEGGHERAHANPLDSLKAYRTELGKHLALRDAVKEMRESGLLKYSMPEKRVGASGQMGGLTKSEPRIHADWEPVKGLSSGGREAYMPRDAATVFDNHLSPGLKGNKYTAPFYDKIREGANRLTQVELGLVNGFHFFVTGNESMLSNMSRGVSEVAKSVKLASQGSLKDAKIELTAAGKSLLSSPFGAVMNYGKGLRMLSAVTGETPKLFGSKKLGEKMMDSSLLRGKITETERSMVKAAQEAGVMPVGRGRAPDVNMTKSKNFFESYVQGSLGREMKELAAHVKDNPLKNLSPAIWDGVLGRALQTTSAPLFDHYIPALKFGSLMENARAAMRQGKWDLRTPQGHEKLVQFLRKESNAIDVRLGEMNVNNTFMNKSLQHAGMATLRSFSWTKGTITALLGGPGGVAKTLAQGVKNRDMGAAMEKLGNKFDMAHKDYDPNLTYAIAFPFGIALMNSVYQYVKSGELPSSFKDLYLPRTGGTNPGFAGRGTIVERVPLPGYHKEIRGAVNDPVHEVTNKLNSLISGGVEQFTGRDGLGRPIVRPNATIKENLTDRAKAAGEKMTPLFVKSVENKPPEGSNLSKVERGLGFKQAAKAYTDPEKTQQFLDNKAKKEWDTKQRSLYREEHGGRGTMPASELRKTYGTADKPAKSSAPSTLVKQPADEWVRDKNQGAR